MEKDKQAKNEAAAGNAKVRSFKSPVLFDGGYLSRALQMLNDKKAR